MKIAAIDIGSNALRLVVKETEHKDFLLSLDERHSDEYCERVPLKSGNDVFGHGKILPPTKIKLALALQHFAQVMHDYGVEAYRACATSAYRDAVNGREIINEVGEACGLRIEIISGDEEARLTRLSFTPPDEWRDDCLLFVDVGGGSTEVSVVLQGNVLYGRSFQVGSMRYLCKTQDLVQEQLLDSEIAGICSRYAPLHYVGAGGCVRFLCSYLNRDKRRDHPRPLLKEWRSEREKGVKAERNYIHVCEMERVCADLQTKTVAQIVAAYGLPEERAEILTPAMSIFLRIARGIGAELITVPAVGVRNGILAELYLQAIKYKQP